MFVCPRQGAHNFFLGRSDGSDDRRFRSFAGKEERHSRRSCRSARRKWLGRDPREFLGMETNEAAKKPRAVVHFKKKKTVQVETAKALGELILAAQRAILAAEDLVGR